MQLFENGVQVGGPKKDRFVVDGSGVCFLVPNCLTAEAVQSAALAFQSVDYIHGSDSLPLGVLGVSDGISDDVFQKHLENTTGLFVNETRDTFDTTTTGKTADGGLGNTLDVVTQDFAVTLSASFSESLSSFSSARHDESVHCSELSEQVCRPLAWAQLLYV